MPALELAISYRTNPFQIKAIVILPDRFHCIWTLPPDEADFSTLIKARFARALPVRDHEPTLRAQKAERGVWQGRFWEHAIQDERDFAAHVDYIHFNPVKHGYVVRAADWPYSSFGRFVERGVYSVDWAADSENP